MPDKPARSFKDFATDYAREYPMVIDLDKEITGINDFIQDVAAQVSHLEEMSMEPFETEELSNDELVDPEVIEKRAEAVDKLHAHRSVCAQLYEAKYATTISDRDRNEGFYQGITIARHNPEPAQASAATGLLERLGLSTHSVPDLSTTSSATSEDSATAARPYSQQDQATQSL